MCSKAATRFRFARSLIFYVYDNSVDDRDAQLVLRAADGRVVKAYGDAPAWTSPILERLAPRES